MSKKYLSPLSFMTILSFLTVLLNCDPNYFGRTLTRNSSNPPTDVVNTPTTGPDPSKDYFNVVTTFAQNNTTSSVAPEILFDVDTSGSMTDEKNALKAALAGWLNQLQQLGVENFCVDVMEAGFDGNSGKLRAATGNPKCLCTDTMSVSDIVSKFDANIDSLNVGSLNGESGVLALHNALNGQFANNQAAGCFRSDHALVAIMMSDENDMGATVRDPSGLGSGCASTDLLTRSDGSTVMASTVDWDNSIFPELDGKYVTTPVTAPTYVSNTCDEEKVRLQYYAEPLPQADGKYHNFVTADSLEQNLSDLNDALPSFGTAIIYNTTTFPHTTGPESQGWGYFEFAAEFNQTPVNLASTANPSDFNTQLNVIASGLSKTLSYSYKFDLPTPVCAGQEDSVKVKVNNTLQASSKYSLNSLRTWIKFKSNFDWAAYGGSKAVVTIDYTKCQ